MPTTKIRKKTPMKNRTCLWRKTAKKHYDGATEIRTGRRLKAAMESTRLTLSMLPIHFWLFKRAGISTPILDKQMGDLHNTPMQDNGLNKPNEGMEYAA